MKISKKSIALLLVFTMLYGTFDNLFSLLIEYSRYLSISHDISWYLLIILTLLTVGGLFIFSIVKILKNSNSLIISISTFVISFLLLYFFNSWIANWFGGLSPDDLSKVVEADLVMAYSQHMFSILIFVCLGISYMIFKD